MNCKIPKMVLSHCQWAHDDDSLNVENLPMANNAAEQTSLNSRNLFRDDMAGNKR